MGPELGWQPGQVWTPEQLNRGEVSSSQLTAYTRAVQSFSAGQIPCGERRAHAAALDCVCECERAKGCVSIEIE